MKLLNVSQDKTLLIFDVKFSTEYCISTEQKSTG